MFSCVYKHLNLRLVVLNEPFMSSEERVLFFYSGPEGTNQNIVHIDFTRPFHILFSS